MEEVLIKREIEKMKEVFTKNNYSLSEKKLYLEARKEIAKTLENAVIIKACELLETQLNEKNDLLL